MTAEASINERMMLGSDKKTYVEPTVLDYRVGPEAL
jgi:hypothetical protein